jgi:ribosome-associated protein
MTFDNEETTFTGPSKSARKRAAKAVEELAVNLVQLGKAQFSRLDLPEEIRKELELARNTKGHGSRKRQIKHLAGLLRKSEELVEELNAYLEGCSHQQYEDKKRFHRLEELRDGLCDPSRFEEALCQTRELFPTLDTSTLTHLAHSVHAGNDRRAFREIFRLLKAAADSGQR